MMFDENDLYLILRAVKYSADKHRHQRRKGKEELPYINHPIEVAEILWTKGRIRDVQTIAAAVLHDTIEDTDARPEEIKELFGEDVLSLILEVSDDKSLPKAVRKLLQVEHAPRISVRAKQIKLGDKIVNVRDIANSPPSDWPPKRRLEYLDWSDSVVKGLRGANEELEDHYNEVMKQARNKLREETAFQ